jgi:hypothetical protein
MAQVAVGQDLLNDAAAGARDGIAAAEKEIREGTMVILQRSGGLAPAGHEPKKRFDRSTGLEVRGYGGGCVVFPYTDAFIDAHNKRVREHVTETRGTGKR